MRELARLRTKATRLRAAQPGREDETLALLEDTLQLVDTLRAECAGLQDRCVELERRLKARMEAGRRLLDALPQPILSTDQAGIILDANRAACLLLSRSRARLIAGLLLHYVEDRERFGSVLRELPHATRTIASTARLRPTDRAPVDVALTVFRDPRADAPEWLWVIERLTQVRTAHHHVVSSVERQGTPAPAGP